MNNLVSDNIAGLAYSCTSRLVNNFMAIAIIDNKSGNYSIERPVPICVQLVGCLIVCTLNIVMMIVDLER